MINEHILRCATTLHLDPAIVHAICKYESKLNPIYCCYGKSPELFKPSEVKPKDCSLETEINFQNTKWGIMGLYGSIYRELEYSDWLPTILSDVECQLKYGCRHLYRLYNKFPRDYVSMYNPHVIGYKNIIDNYARGWVKEVSNE